MHRRHLLGRPSLTAPVAASALVAPPPTAPLPYAGGLAPYVPTPEAPWDQARARHLVRRTGIGTPRDRVTAALATTPADAVRQIVDDALAAGTPPRPSWADLMYPATGASQAEIDAYNAANSAGNNEARAAVFDELRGLRHPGSPLRERLALMWHGHLTAHHGDYGSRAARLFRYWDLLRTHALGDFQALVRAMGITQAMLIYLDGSQNRVGRPNENYARELLELFTTGLAGPDGQPTYTQTDIEELARALTGWTAPSRDTNEGVFVESRFDAGLKTIFGVTDAFTYGTAHDLLFAQRADAIAHTVCLRLYREFVHEVPNDAVVAEMRALFLPGFSVEPVVRALLGSQHFFTAGAVATRLKTPMEITLGLAIDSGYSDLPSLYSYLRSQATGMGYDLFRPPDVAGWDGGRTWLDTSRLPARWLFADRWWTRRREATALAMSLPSNAFDPYALVDGLADHVVAVPLPAATRAECVAVLLGGIPDYEWNPLASTAETRIRAALSFLTRLPEFQLA